MKLINYLLIASFCTYCFSCVQPGQSESVSVADSVSVNKIPEDAIQLEVDTLFSVVTWIGSKPTGKHNGIISINGGDLYVLKNEIVGGTITFNIQSLLIRDISKDSEKYLKLYDHLMSEDFFQVDSFPTGSFQITKIIPFDSTLLTPEEAQFQSDNAPASLQEFMDPNPTHLVTGNLNLRGVSKSISFPAIIQVSQGKIKAEAKFNINRTDWNLNYDSEANVLDKAKDKFIYNTVNVGFSLRSK